MSLSAATLIPGVFLLLVGGGLFSGSKTVVSSLRRLPRSHRAAWVFFGAGALWFLYQLRDLSSADFGDYRNILMVFFGALAVLSFVCVPEFLAVRGLCVLMLLGASPLLDAGYMIYDKPLIYLYRVPVFLGIALAIWLGAQPWRLRDFFDWLFRPGGRARAVGALLLAYGVLLAIVAFTY